MRQLHKGDVVRYVPTSFSSMDAWAEREQRFNPLLYLCRGTPVLVERNDLPTPGAVGIVKFEPYGAVMVSVEMPFYGLYSIAAVDLEWVGQAESAES